MKNMLGNNETLLLFCSIFICVKNLIISRLFAILSSKKTSIFLYNRKIIKQTLIIWAISTFSDFLGYIFKYIFLSISNKSFIRINDNFISQYFSITTNDNPLINVLSFAISFGLCFSLVLLFGKIMQTQKRVITALIIAALCAPYDIAFPIKDFDWTFCFIFGVVLFIFLIPYFFYKHFSSIIYRINRKKNKDISDNRIKCIISAFIGQFVGFAFLLVFGAVFDLDLYLRDPYLSLHNPNYSNPNVPLYIFGITFFIGLLINFIFLLVWCFKPYSKTNKPSVTALSILNAPYVLFVIYIILFVTK